MTYQGKIVLPLVKHNPLAQRKVDHRDRAIEMREQARRAKTLHPLVRRHFS